MAQPPIFRMSAVRVLELRTNCGKSQFSLVLPFNLFPSQPVLGGHCLRCYPRCSWKTLDACILFHFACIYMSTTYVSGIGWGQREGTRSLEVELQVCVSLSVGTGYWSRILWLLIPNPLEEQPLLSTAWASLQSLESSLVTIFFVLTMMLVLCDKGSLLW